MVVKAFFISKFIENIDLLSNVRSELSDSSDEEIEAKLLGGEELYVLEMEVTLR